MHTTPKRFLWTLLCTSLIGSPTFVQAQDNSTIANYVPEGNIEQNKARDRKGWDGTFGINAQLSLAQNSNVVGQNDGTSFLAGLGLVGGLDYIYGKHEWRNTLTLNESFAQTPVLPNEWLKTNDVLTLEALYNYFLLDWAGAFGRLDFDANALPTFDIRADLVTYSITDGSQNTRTTKDTRLKLAGSFSQLTLNQSLGLFGDILKSAEINWSVRLGFGFRESFTQGVLVVTDDANTSNVELKELDNVFQGGAELYTGIRGEMYEKRMKYSIGLSGLLPFINNDPQNRSAIALTRIGVAGTLSFNIFDWMSLNFQSKVLSDPQLLDEIQIQNNILLSFQYTFIQRKPPATKVGPSELEIANTKAAQAEARAKAAEERAKSAEEAAKKLKEAEQKNTLQQPASSNTLKKQEAPKTPKTPETPK